MNEKEVEKQIQNIILKKRELYLKQDLHEIKNSEYDEQIEILEEEYSELIKQKINIINKKIDIRDEKIKEKEVERKQKVQSIKKPIKKDNIQSGQSYTKLIINLLAQPKIDSEDKLVAVIKELKKETEEHNLRRQIKNITSEIKNKNNNKYVNYMFDEKQYMVKEAWQGKLF